MNLPLQSSSHVEDSQILWRGPLKGLQIRFHYPRLFSISQSLLKDNAAHDAFSKSTLIVREEFVYIYNCFDSNFSNILEIIGSILTGR